MPDNNDTDELSTPGSDAGVTEIPPIDAPSDSHLKSFWYIDRKFAERGGPSQLFVIFREQVSKKTGKIRPEATYVYTSMDHESLRQTFEKLSIASSPGEILFSDLISRGNAGSPV